VWIQLLVALEKLGCEGNGASIGRIARSAGISSGAVTLYTQRVVRALLDLKREFLRWPDAQERARTAARFQREYHLPNAIGVIDGTHIHFSQKPAVDGEVYWTRKSRYSLNAQIVCDLDRKIIYYQVGWPGSIFDQTAFAQTVLHRSPGNFMSENQYLLGDSGYTATARMLTPYRNPIAELKENAIFNLCFSRARVIVEHTIGILKSRWSSLRGIRTQFRTAKDLEYINSQIVAIFVLHNIAISKNDDWRFDWGIDDLIPPGETIDLNHVQNGDDLREEIKQYVLSNQ
jgi:hypothetical protein